MADRMVALAEWEPTILAIATSVSRRYPHTTWEDVAQELRVWWIGTRRVDSYLDEDTEGDKAGTKKLVTSLTRVARGLCEQEKAQARGYSVDDLFWYTSGALRELLPMLFDPECPLGGTPDESGIRSKRPPNEGGGLLAARADVARGLELLPQPAKDLLLAIYRDGASEAELAAEAGISTEGMNKRHDRALNALRDRLGGERPIFHDGPGSRHAISNARAQAMTGVE